MANYEILYNLKDENGNTLGSKLKPRGHSNGISLSEFARIYFSDASGVQKLYNVIDGARKKWPNSVYAKVLSPDFNNFFKDYACDLDWAKSTNYCGGITPDNFEINDYIGDYTDKLTNQKFLIRTEDGQILKIIAFGEKADLTPFGTDVFKIIILFQSFNVSGTLKFVRDATTKKVTKFTYKLDIPPAAKVILGDKFKNEGEAVKDAVSDLSDKYSDDKWLYFSGKSSSPYPKKDKKNKKDSSQQANANVIKIGKHVVQMPKNIHSCDENAIDWEIGCKNNKIKLINQKLMGDELDGVYTDELRKELINLNFIRPNITNIPSSVYDRISKMNLDESTVQKINLNRFYKLVNKKL